jgi:heme-degrading monooxygenase HmoA
MSVLLIDLQVRPGEESHLEDVFKSTFRPAISQQAGFQAVDLLRPASGSRWVIEIRFVDETSRLAWVATDLHQEVWPQIDAHCAEALAVVFEPVP